MSVSKKTSQEINDIIYGMLDSEDKVDFTELFKYLDKIRGNKVDLKDDEIVEDADLTDLVKKYIDKKSDKKGITNYINKLANFSITEVYNFGANQWTAEGVDPSAMVQQDPYANQGGMENLGIDPSAIPATMQDPNGAMQPQVDQSQMQGQVPPQVDPSQMQQVPPQVDPNAMQQVPQQMDPNAMQGQPQVDPSQIQTQNGQVDPSQMQAPPQQEVPPQMDPNAQVPPQGDPNAQVPPAGDPNAQVPPQGDPNAQAVSAVPQQNNVDPNMTQPEAQVSASEMPGQVIADEGNFKAGMIPGEKYTTAYVAFSVKNGYSVKLYKLPRGTKLTNFSQLVKLPSKSVKVKMLNDLTNINI